MSRHTGLYIEDLSEGQSASFSKTVTEADVVMFAGISGDTNPVHVDAEFAKGTMFKERIAHGMLTAGFISTVLGTKLPGPGAIYLSQTLTFKAPVKIGDTVVATCTVETIKTEKRRALIHCLCKVGETTVIEGEAVILVPSRKT